MGCSCLVKQCVNSIRRKKEECRGISFHRVPTSMESKLKWARILRIPVGDLSNWKRICREHFKESDFDLNGNLKIESLPSINLPMDITHSAEICIPRKPSSSTTVLIKVGDNVLQLKLCRGQNEGSRNSSNLVFSECISKLASPSQMPITQQVEQVQDRLLEYRRKQKHLKTQVKRLQADKKTLRGSRDTWIRKWKVSKEVGRNALSLNILQNKQQQLTVKNELLQPFRKIFTPSQLEMILENKTKTWWSELDVVRGITLRAKSNKAYNFVRDEMNIPMPCISTLKRWTSEIRFQPGILVQVLDLMKSNFRQEPQINRICVLSFDEMMIDSRVCYDHTEDMIYGPKGKMMVVIIRGLFNSWKQPIYYEFDVDFTKELFDSILFAINEAELDLRATVNDLDGKNRRLWNDLGVSYDGNSFYVNPYTNKRIYFFADIPHMMKLMRNNILDYGLRFPSGNVLSKKDFSSLLSANKSELKITFKISNKHLEAEGRERQRVYLATQLLSRSVARSMSFLFPEKSEEAEFVEITNDFFDIMNSRVIEDFVPLRCAFGITDAVSKAQLAVLDKMEEYMWQLKINKKTKTGKQWQGLFPFQKGIITSIKSMKGLYQDLCEEFQVKYILTHRLNQDVLENCFSVIRSVGIYHDHPSIYEAKHRLKTMLLSWNAKVKTGAVQNEDDTPVFSSNLLRSLVSEAEDNSLSDAEIETLTNEFSCRPIIPLTPLNWEDFLERLSTEQSVELGGQEYVCGFIASRFRKAFPQLMLSQTSSDYNQRSQSWTQHVSRGNLTTPSYSWLNLFRNYEQYFESFHKSGGDRWKLNRSNKVMKKLEFLLISKYPNVPEEVVKFYVRTRTFIRINWINETIQESRRKFLRRNRKHLLSSVPADESVSCEQVDED